MPLLDGRSVRLFTVLTRVLALLLTAPARAELPVLIALEWPRDSACPRSSALDDELARLLGPAFEYQDPASFRVRVTATKKGDYELQLSVATADTRSERRVLVASCEEANEAAALLIATALDPSAALRPLTAEPAKPEADPPPPQPEPKRASEPASEAQVRETEPSVVPRPAGPWGLFAKARLDTTTLPGVSGGPALGLMYAVERLQVWVEASWLLPREVEAPDSNLSAELSLYAATIGASYPWSLGRFTLGPALLFSNGLLHGSASGPSTHTDNVLWLELFAGSHSVMQISSRLALTGELLAGAPIRRPRLARRSDEPFYVTKSFTFQAALGLRVSLGAP